MWKFPDIILKHRVVIIFILFGITACMIYKGFPPRFSYEMAKILPSDHPPRTDFENFIFQNICFGDTLTF